MDDIPVRSTTSMDKEYLALLGETIFLYNMLECTLIDIVDRYVDGTRRDYYLTYRYNPKDVLRLFKRLIDDRLEVNEDRQEALRKIERSFPQAIDIRSAVAHGHPSTDPSDPKIRNRQVLSCQTGDYRLCSDKAFPNRNRYDDVQLTFSVLADACRELESTCAFARRFLSELRNHHPDPDS